MSRRVTIWHNPRCSKSRQALALLTDAGANVELREYLQHPPTRTELAAVLSRLGLGPRDIVRRSEAPYADLKLDAADDDALIDAMVKHPILIERPIAFAGDRAVVGRPPERVKALLD